VSFPFPKITFIHLYWIYHNSHSSLVQSLKTLQLKEEWEDGDIYYPLVGPVGLELGRMMMMLFMSTVSDLTNKSTACYILKIC
jgi:hypothetical protein